MVEVVHPSLQHEKSPRAEQVLASDDLNHLTGLSLVQCCMHAPQLYPEERDSSVTTAKRCVIQASVDMLGSINQEEHCGRS